MIVVVVPSRLFSPDMPKHLTQPSGKGKFSNYFVHDKKRWHKLCKSVPSLYMSAEVLSVHFRYWLSHQMR